MTATYAELCAGYGGLGLAVEEVFDAELAWYSEFDAAPSKIMAHHWPDAPNHGDMTAINWAKVMRVLILSGGTPCQDLSTAGRRKGMTDGTRSNLWVCMREAIAELKPKYVIWENVRGAYSAKADSDLEHCPRCMGDARDERTVLRALGRVLGDFSDLGYDTQWRGLRATDVGSCHKRFRVFVLARRREAINDAPCDGSRKGNLPARICTPSRDGTSLADESDSRLVRPESGQTLSNPMRGGSGGRTSEPRPAGLDNAAIRPDSGGSRAGTLPDSVSSRRSRWARKARREAIFRTAAERSSEGFAWGEYEPYVRRWERVLGRRAPRPTEPTGRNGGHQLSPRFEEWMMGLEDGWVTDPDIGISKNEQIKALGNGVVRQQAAAALWDMRTAFERLDKAGET